MNRKPYAESCDQNKTVILTILKHYTKENNKIFEIGSGTGQHACYFTSLIDNIIWQTSDQQENIEGIALWISDANNHQALPPPIILDVTSGAWPTTQYDLIFSANTLHIMSKTEVIAMFEGTGKTLKNHGFLCTYGPYNYNGAYTCASNEQFDQWLKNRNPQSGIKDFEWLNTLATDNEMILVNDHKMPANNRILVWQKHQNVSSP